MISVIIPYIEDRGYLTECVNSIENQTFRDFEVIHAKGNNSLGKNVNNGVKKAKGEFIKVVAEDDKLTPNALKDLSEGISNYDWVVGSAVNFINEDDYPFSKFLAVKTDIQLMLERNQIHGGTPLYRKDLWGRFQGWDEKLTTGEEYDWHLKLLKNETNLAYIKDVVCWYRLWNGSKSGNGQSKERDIIINQIKARYK